MTRENWAAQKRKGNGCIQKPFRRGNTRPFSLSGKSRSVRVRDASPISEQFVLETFCLLLFFLQSNFNFVGASSRVAANIRMPNENMKKVNLKARGGAQCKGLPPLLPRDLDSHPPVDTCDLGSKGQESNVRSLVER